MNNRRIFITAVLLLLVLLTSGTFAENAQFDTDIPITAGQTKTLEFTIPNVNEKLSVEVIPRESFTCKVKFNGFEPAQGSNVVYPNGLNKPYMLFDWIVDVKKEYNVVFRYVYDRTRVRQRGFEEDTMRIALKRSGESYSLLGSGFSVSTRTKTIAQGGSQRDVPSTINSFMIIGKEEDFLNYGSSVGVSANTNKILTIRDQNSNRVGLKVFFFCTQTGQVSLTKQESLVPNSNVPSNTIDLDGWIGFKLAETNQNSCEVSYEYDLFEAGRVTKVNQILNDNNGKEIKAMVYSGSGSYSFLATKRQGDVIMFTQETKSQDSNSFAFIVANGVPVSKPIPKPKVSETTDKPTTDKPTQNNSTGLLNVNVYITLMVVLFSLISFTSL